MSTRQTVLTDGHRILAAPTVEHWYVYFKLPVADLPATLPRLRALQARLSQATAMPPRLQARVDTPDGVATVMEVYGGVVDPAGFGARLDAALAESDLPAALRGSRRTERFRDL